MPVDVAALRRRYKPERLLPQLSLRSDTGLVPAAAAIGTRRVLLDTTVYIHELAGTLPAEARRLLDGALHFHSPLCIAEVLSGLSNLHPGSPFFRPAWAHYDHLFSAIPRIRLLTPDEDVLAQAGVVAGLLARTQNYARSGSRTLFNDAAIYLTAAKRGLPVLTANRGDCDLIQQITGVGAFIHYAAVQT